jgi:hypothetical protein
MVVLLATAGASYWIYRNSRTPGPSPQPQQQFAQPDSTNPTLLENGTRLDYERCPDNKTLAIHISAPGNPLIYFDTNHNGKPDVGDIGYAMDSYGQQCTLRLDNTGTVSPCSNRNHLPSDHTTQPGINAVSTVRTVNLQVPLSDLALDKAPADFIVETFNEQTQKSDFRSAPPFQKVFHLNLGEISVPRTLRYCNATGNHGTEEFNSSPSHQSPPPLPPPPPPTVSFFEATPPSIEFKGYVKLRWSVQGATNISVTPGIGNAKAIDEINVPIDQTTRFALRARNGSGEATSFVTVDVNPPLRPQIVTFNAQPQTVSGNSTRLAWQVSGFTTRIRIDPGMDSIPAQGEREVPIGHSTTFHLIAEGPGGVAQSDLAVLYKPEAPKIAFNAVKGEIYKGETTTLRWNVSNATHIAIMPGIADYPVDTASVNGEIRITPDETTLYTLVAEGLGGTAIANAEVLVRPPGPSKGQLVWTGEVNGVQLVTVDLDHADVGTLEGKLPGMPCILQPEKERIVSIASTPGPRNNYQRLVFRVKGKGTTTVVINWSLQ